MPRTAASERATFSMVSSPTLPKAAPSVFRLTVMILSTMNGHQQNRYGGRCMCTKPVGLNDQCGPRIAKIALNGDGDKLATLHAAQPSTSARATSMNFNNARSALSAFAANLDWRRHSAAKLGRRVSGTQIWAGRNPALRMESRRFCTRAATEVAIRSPSGIT